MHTEEIKEMIDKLQIKLQDQVKNYDKALDANAGFNERRDIRTRMREIGEEIIVLNKKLKEGEKP